MWLPRSLRREGPRYLAIADAIQQDVQGGRLKAGAQLPPQRELAGKLGVDFTTVTRAYAEARRRGLIVGQVGRGTFVRASGDAGASTAAATSVIDLSLNFPPHQVTVAAADALSKTLGRISRCEVERLLMYHPSAGLESHRAAGAAWISWRGVDATPDRVVVCSGAQHGLTVLLSALLRPGDLVFTESLSYAGFRGLADLLGLRVEGIPVDEDGLSPDALRHACQRQSVGGKAKAIFCVPTIQNPTATVMPNARRQQIASLAREHGLIIIEDDIYGALSTSAPRPLAAHAPDRSYYLSGTSKSLAAGLRIAFVLAPTASDAARLADSTRLTTWMAVPLMAEVVARWIEDGTAARLLDLNRGVTAARQEIARAVLGRWRPRSRPEAFHIWLELPPPWAAADFAMQARQRGVVVTPAEAFVIGTGPAPSAIRLSLGVPESPATLEHALGILARMLEAGPRAGAAIL